MRKRSVTAVPEQADVVVVGGGICGHACALSAATRGARVILVDKEAGPAVEASGRAQGSLRLQGREPAELPLARETMDLWAAAGKRAGAEHDFELTFGGNAYVCDDEHELPTLERLVDTARAAGLTGVRLLAPDRARELVPALRGPFVAAMYSPVDGACQPDKATRYFAHRAREEGALPYYGVRALRVLAHRGKVRGLVTDHGTIRCGAVVVTAGIWTPYLTETVGVRVPVMPVALTDAETTPATPLFDQTIRAFSFGARPRPDGRVVFSAGLNTTVDHALTLDDLHDLRLWAPRLVSHWRDVRLSVDVRRIGRQITAGSTRAARLVGAAPVMAPNAGAIRASFHAMRRLIPDLSGVSIARMWTGMVDMSPDGMPILDGDAGPAGLVIATGLSGHGLTLGPVIGEITADLALDGGTERPIRPFRLRRFREEKVRIPEKMI